MCEPGRSARSSYFLTGVMVVIASFAVSCSRTDVDRKQNIVIATSLPVFASIIRELASPDDELVVLLSQNQSPHEYQPRPSDVRRFDGADMVFLGHPDLDGWASRLTDSPIQFLASENKSFEKNTSENDTSENNTFENNLSRSNPHFWFDPLEVERSARVITENLCRIRPKLCPVYTMRLNIFASDLIRLDSTISSVVTPIRGKSVVTSHPFFEYFLARYGIESLVTLQPSPGHEASPLSVTQILDKIRAKKPLGMITQKYFSSGVFQIIGDETDLPIVYIDPVGITGLSYNDFMLLTASNLISLIQD